MKIPFGGRVLVLGCGAVSRSLLPLLLRHFDMDFSKLTVIDFEDYRHEIVEAMTAGAHWAQEKIAPDNLATALGRHLGAGDLLIDLAWNIDCGEIVQWCHDHNVLYINTSVELWDPNNDSDTPQFFRSK